jgi:hypothetical protein
MSEMGVPRSDQANYFYNALSASALKHFTSTYLTEGIMISAALDKLNSTSIPECGKHRFDTGCRR